MKKQVLFLLLGMFVQYGYSQKVVWEKSIGGAHSDYLFDMVPTVDYGFILAGSSLSDKTGVKREKGTGSLDYFLWKMNKDGEEEWQLSFGGDKNDFLKSIAHTPDNGFILGGYSDSNLSRNKTTLSYGKKDIWIIKLNAKGVEEWQKSFGGTEDDEIVKILPTKDKGFIIIANSMSNKSNTKSNDSKGSFDYWIIKLDKNGEKLWDKTIGGIYNDLVKDIIEQNEGFLVVGNSNSPISGDKKVVDYGDFHNWILKLDTNGNLMNQWSFGGNGEDLLETALFINDHLYIFGKTNSTEGTGKIEEAKFLTDLTFKILDKQMNIISQKTYDFNGIESLTNVHFFNDEILISGNVLDIEKQKSSFITLKIDDIGNELERSIFESKSHDVLSKTTITREGNFVLAGTSYGKTSRLKSKQIGRNDFWIVKLGKKNKVSEEEIILEAFPNPTEGYTNIVLNHKYLKGEMHLFDLNGRLLFSEVLKYDMIAVDLSKYASGVYVINIVTDVINQSIKVIKK